MTSLKRAQLRQQAKNRVTTPNTDTSNGTSDISNPTEKKND